MGADRSDGSKSDLERFSEHISGGSTAVEAPSPFERRLAWSVMDRAGVSSSTALRSGITLSATTLTWERSWSMALDIARSPIKFVLARGPSARVTTDEGDHHELGGTFHINGIHRATNLRFDFGDRVDGRPHEQLALEVDRERLAELLGAATLPAPVERILSRARAYATAEYPMSPRLFRLLDEIVHCDARGASRRLYLEGKGLELLATIVDQLEEDERGASPLLSQHDVDRLERARQILLARIEAPPTLPELARRAGLNEAKLKAGFRTLFGRSVFAYLRDHRMDVAHTLLLQRRYNVTEVAQRVGYENPSKFAAAFRKRFGVSPSTVA